MRSTHACTPSFRNFSSPIFTSVVVYSRTTTFKHQITKTCEPDPLAWNQFGNSMHNESNKKAKRKKKCGAHTHVHHLSLSLFSIFTSVVVYSRTTTTKNSKETNLICYCTDLNPLRKSFNKINLHSCATKKNAEHTRMYTNFRAFLANIHVGCCLFSHDPTKHSKKH